MVVAEKQVDPEWAWARYEPDAQRPWTLALAGHLYRRAGFGADWNQLRQALDDGPHVTIDRLLHPQGDIEAFNRTCDDYESSLGGSESADALKAWWLRRMMNTPHPLLEKMTLFWHGYFAVSNATVKNARFMHLYLKTLRANALGSFATLLKGMTDDTAMLVSLDAAASRKAHPNDSFPRALLEVFTVGPGQYTDKDVAETAKAFTGRFVRRGRLQYIAREHDGGGKEILGRRGNFTDKDVLGILLENPATAGRVVRRLYRLLISETAPPDEAAITPLAESFAKDYDVAALAETMLRSNLFFSPGARRKRVKCPVEFAVGIAKGLEAMVSTTQLAADLAALGQNLCHPPTVNGWTGGQYWINDATLAGRHNLAAAMLLGDSKAYGKKLDPWKVAQSHGKSDLDSAVKFLIDLFLQGDVRSDLKYTPDSTDRATDLRQLAYSVVTLPEFQLA